ncbi:formylglycine-generating enzyme family protein [Paenibacillus sp. FJAT-26967]|uniref:formylglycine-generating enzyme family protein n=1 Tax=Paenibacillus sp. FJAT-26967 TaxID=1729690 RepID=UPI0008385437|nr:formylglycine-generating enzyme family protein [Paenibacillus sp. FJAT-26967]
MLSESRSAPSCCGASRANLGAGAGSQPGAGKLESAGTTGSVFADRSVEDPLEGMILLPGGSFHMGTDDEEGFPADGEGPVHEVSLSPFYVDKYCVSNEQFERFTAATGYVTEAEHFGWSYVFQHYVSQETADLVVNVPQQTPWWYVVNGADWRHPEGPDSTIIDRMNHPAVHLSWNDADAYCKWSGKRLLTEAEWEYAARGGLHQKRYPWGDELKPGGSHHCNIWQGKFHVKDNGSDGYRGTAPVDAYEPNGYGLYNAAGNVWEWCSDWFDPGYYSHSPTQDPAGPSAGSSRVMRGGSYLCHKSYCNRYRTAARSKNTPDSSSGNIGFRCAADA